MNIVFSQELALELYQSKEEFPIDFDLAYRWLEYSRKDNAKTKFMKCEFVEGIDFRLLKTKETRQDGSFSHYREQIDLTVECFKLWGMRAGTDKGKEIRLYFLECEKLAKKIFSKTPAELMVYYAEQLVKQERRLFELEAAKQEQEARLDTIEAEQERYYFPSGRNFTVMGFANLRGIKISAIDAAKKGRNCSKLCREAGIQVERIHDPRFGKIGMYPENILVEVFNK